ncbi:response regulator [Flavobacterium terrigena]|uniref:Response regulator receiver domain-containing protein n=1 Tax=Flavobacterium terrigena TaxID=402734 RepID=A0A1H6TP70_9FLAO|nr:response regulator [Flavobacterium terrigena]SEI81833.1 Response regulator receiver domain-containing protein [Flavobacterium terrigena]
METNAAFLLIEDNLIDQLITTKLLKNTFDDFQFNVVSDGKEGMDWLYKFNYTSKDQLIILLDIKMPQMDGFEFLAKYDALPEDLKKKTQIFMLSSSLDPNDLKRANENCYVKKLFSKPLSLSQFKEIISIIDYF